MLKLWLIDVVCIMKINPGVQNEKNRYSYLQARRGKAADALIVTTKEADMLQILESCYDV